MSELRVTMAGSTLVCSVLLMFGFVLQLSTAQMSCRDSCGEPFSRGQVCSCDEGCLTHDDCCKDYEEVCTNRASCRGRCQEAFRRGRECECDPDCTRYNSCCSDYSAHCNVNNAPAAKNAKQAKPADCVAGELMVTLSGGEQRPDTFGDGAGPTGLGGTGELMPLTADLGAPTGGPSPLDAGLYEAKPESLALHTSDLPHADALAPVETLTIPVQMSLSISGDAGGAVDQPSSVLDLHAGRPSTLTDLAQALQDHETASVPIESSNPDLCDGQPIDGLTATFNGSIIVFRGNFFWMLDPKTRAAGPARSITEELGVPSPIDTAFTRCNCQGKTYIIKGDQYWSFESGVMEPGYPRSVAKDFGGLTGEIVAALSVPANRKRAETVYFFKKGGSVQKLTYPAGSAPTCNGGKKASNSAATKNRQPEVRLSGEINIKLKWKGFPTPVTSALSMPNSRKPDGFEHFVFSGPKVFTIKVVGEIPALASPAKPSAEQNELRNWLGCP